MQDLPDIIRALQVSADSIEETDMASDAIVLLRLVDKDGGVRLWCGHNEGQDWMGRLGMLAAAHDMELPGRQARWADRDED